MAKNKYPWKSYGMSIVSKNLTPEEVEKWKELAIKVFRLPARRIPT